MPRWRLYYADGTIFSSDDGLPGDAPAFGVQCAVQPDPEVGRLCLNGWDWYYYHHGHREWWGSDLHGLLDHLLHRTPITAICQGRNVHNTDYRRIMKRAQQDPDFPRKSGVRKSERP